MSIGKIESVATAGDAVLAVAWDDGHRAAVSLAALIADRPVLAVLADPEHFSQAVMSDDGWSVEWRGCGIDFGASQLRRWADEQAGEAMSSTDFRGWTERHDLTLDRAADALGLSRRTIAYYLSGEQPVPKAIMLATEGYDRRQAA